MEIRRGDFYVGKKSTEGIQCKIKIMSLRNENLNKDEKSES